MNQPEKFKDVTINERTFRIKKFPALSGGFAMFKIIGILAPLAGQFQKLDFQKILDAENPADNLKEIDLEGLMAAIGSVKEEDFKYLQDNALKVAYQLLPAGETPVLNKDGTFGVIGLEEDSATVLWLTVHAIFFNVKSFFAGSPLASTAQGLLSMFQPTSST